MKDGKVDYAVFSEMVDLFMAGGFNYFDTARVYLGGQSETAIRDCLVKRYPRESFVLADKLSSPLFSREEDIVPLFEKQLASCGVGYFDFYLMHAQTRTSFEKYRDCRAYETAFGLKRQGRIRHVGISFHDTAEVLDMILTAYPAIEFVQIQFNYVDYDDPTVQSKDVYDVCRRYGKPVIVMEPVKGGSLANLPDDARAVFDRLSGGSAASYAVRYAAGFDGVMTVLSGMSNTEQMKDNLSYMTDFRPLDGNEMKAVDEGEGHCTVEKTDPLYILPLLHRRMSEAHSGPGVLLLSQFEAGIPRQDCRRRLRKALHRSRCQCVRLRGLRQMRKIVSSASADKGAAQRGRG